MSLKRTDIAAGCALLLAALASFWGLGSYGLVESSDARYAEIAREMWVSGDWIFPRLLGIHHFHKPPLIYWLTCLGYTLCGLNEWGARLMQGVLAVGLAVLVGRFARRHLGGEAAPAILFAAGMPLVVGATRMVTTDLLLTVLMTWALTAWYDARSGVGGPDSLLAFWIATGLAFLAKGPVAWLVLALIIGPHALLDRGKAVNRRWGAWWGVPLALLVALPWYLYVVLKTPGLFGYFTGTQIAARLQAGGMGHPRPLLYFLLIFPLLNLPWLFFLPAGRRALRLRDHSLARFLLLWALVPPFFFSLPSTKLPLYVLPASPAVALLAAAAFRYRADLRRPIRMTANLLLLIAMAMLLLAMGMIPLKGGDIAADGAAYLPKLLFAPGMVFAVAGLAVFLLSWRRWTAAAWVSTAALVFLTVWAFGHAAMLPMKSARVVGLAAAHEWRAGDRLVMYRTLTDGLPFYLPPDIPLPIIAEVDRETQFEEGQSNVIDHEAFLRLWNGPERVLAVTTAKNVPLLVGGRIISRESTYALVANH